MFSEYLESNLSNVFSRWGKVCDLFIAKKGFRFGFVRYEGDHNEKELEWNLDQKIVNGGNKMHVNAPRYRKMNGKEYQNMERIEGTH
ncbi:hypothetical protein GmHk_14G040552 [Glycine max]|nr:hypothetical protein GmHk_14G040552 [Glycine max]